VRDTVNLVSTIHVEQPSWYCVRTKPKHEHIAAAGLMRHLGLEVFHPRMRLERSTRRGFVRVTESLFPCYIFVRCLIEERVDEIRYSIGVSSLVRFGQRIAVVPDPVIDDLRECFEADEPMPVEERLRAGDEVTVNGGPFMGFDAIVLRVLPARRRVQILLDVLGRPTLVEVDRTTVTPDKGSMADLVPSLALRQELRAA
jgi:transcriptional antiterminator RfaH